MESRWRDLVVLDYEVDFPTASRLELALYSTGAALAPGALLGERQRWGVHRHPGLLEVPASHYDRVLDEFGVRCADPRFVRGLGERLAACVGRLARATADLAGAEPPDTTTIRGVVDALTELMAFHVLNWALPLPEIEGWLARFTEDGDAARALLMRLLVPTTPAHLVDVAALTAAAHRDIHAGAWSPGRAADLSARIGHLQAPGLAVRPFEDPATLEAYVRSLDAGDVDHLGAMRRSRNAAQDRLARDTSMLLLATGGEPADVDRAWAYTAVCRLAAEEEEQRRRWQGASLRAIRIAAERAGVRPDAILPSACDADGAAPEHTTPVLDPSDEAWAWLRS
ncbi:hypothetical protein [Micromonospora sp. URMC 103]|uniref:hypothetical protein n=1 Tax=Micromonospora sp. URMC 103 TaxID=3423406 RepID=UPI003F19A552